MIGGQRKAEIQQEKISAELSEVVSEEHEIIESDSIHESEQQERQLCNVVKRACRL